MFGEERVRMRRRGKKEARECGIAERDSPNYYRLAVRDVAQGGKGISVGRTPAR